ncbi:DNA methyltransferase [Spiroplasma endosymbiont of Eupeodes luniger]|uniref:DNA methyltransferase n=1 Tax=Spiroplasma endosymbiont of Eupeodes luniger TaxID=3066300 RepID=UPI0030D3441A
MVDSKNAIKYLQSSIKQINKTDNYWPNRIFYCPKITKKDRDEGLEAFAIKLKDIPIFRKNIPKVKNDHPTVKPTNLMQYLVRMFASNNAIILDPFMGSGSTGKAIVY